MDPGSDADRLLLCHNNCGKLTNREYHARTWFGSCATAGAVAAVKLLESYACRRGLDKSFARRIGRLRVKRSSVAQSFLAVSRGTAKVRPSCGGNTPKLDKLMPLHQSKFKMQHRSRPLRKVLPKRISAAMVGSEKFTAFLSHQCPARDGCGIGVQAEHCSAK